MRKYETVFISDPDLSDQSRTELFDKVRNIITNENGILIRFDEWGNKKLAYEIRKKLRGHYVCVTYGGNGDLVKELERNFRLTDDIMKFMTIVLTEDQAVEIFEKEAQEQALIKESRAPESDEDDESDAADDDDDAAGDDDEDDAADDDDDEDSETEKE